VDMFFVVSGFLITSLLLVEWHRRDRVDLKRFWLRRARRLLPALFLVLVGVSVYAAFTAAPSQAGQIRGDGLASFGYFANWHFIATGQSYVFNLRRDKFQDPRVREAIGLMFNFEWSNETLFFGTYDRVDSFWENSELEPEGPPGADEVAILQPLVDEGLIDAALLTEPPVGAPESGAKQLDRANRERAGLLLDEAGWVTAPPPPRPPRLGLVPAGVIGIAILVLFGVLAMRSPQTGRRVAIGASGLAVFGAVIYVLALPRPSPDDGMRRKDGRLLSIEVLEDSPTFDRVHNPFVSNLQALGVDARLNRVDPAQYTDLTRSHEFDIVVDQFPTGYEPGSGLMQYFGSEGVDDVFNSMGLSDPAVDSLIQTVMAAETRDELHVAVKALDRVLRAKRFWIPQWFKDVHTVAYYDYLRYPEPLPPYALGQIDFWWADQDAYETLRASGAL
ncbi:hypothetical protein LCGC14_2453630, partial [marine sediment metagenome]